MEQLLELLTQIHELAGAGVEALTEVLNSQGGAPPEGAAPDAGEAPPADGAPPEGPPEG